MFEFLAIRGNEEARRCMMVILDWESADRCLKHKNWINIDRKCIRNNKFGKKTVI